MLTTVTDVPRGEAKLFKRMGTHLVEDIFNLGFRAGQPIGLEREAFDAACDRLAEAGYTLVPRDQAWAAFRGGARDLLTRLEAMASFWAAPAAQWLGDPIMLRQPLHANDDP